MRIGVGALSMALACAAAAHAGGGADARIAKARAAIKGLGDGLKGQLMAAIEAGGPASAIGVCKTMAPELAREASAAHGVTVRRTALELRNPENAPDAFERRVLEEFLAKAAAGADVAALDHAESETGAAGRPVLRYMKAIPMAGEPCGLCHGAAVDPALAAEIGRLYPADRATGFKPGEVRGAFSVVVE
jgi:hypothetical protein